MLVFMKIVNLFLITVFSVMFFSCVEKASDDRDVTDIDYLDNEDLPMNAFVDAIEVVPLETDSTCLIDQFHKIAFYDEIGVYLIIDKKQTVYLFSADGRYISNSKACRGNGPNEYTILTDAVYNPYTKHIEILNPFGTIYAYDLSFQFQGKKDLKNGNIHTFSRFYPLDDNSYILLPTMLGEKDAVICFCDYSKQEITSTEVYIDDFVCTLTMNYNPFVQMNARLYFLPLCLDYTIYNIGENRQLNKYITYSFGGKDVRKEEMEERFGDVSDKKTSEKSLKKTVHNMEKINDYLLRSDYPVPVIKMMDDSYLYFYIMRNGGRETVIYDRMSGRIILHSNKQNPSLNFCLHLNGKQLYSIMHPYEIDRYVDKHLLDADNLDKINSIKEDDNPIIIKYRLK